MQNKISSLQIAGQSTRCNSFWLRPCLPIQSVGCNALTWMSVWRTSSQVCRRSVRLINFEWISTRYLMVVNVKKKIIIWSDKNWELVCSFFIKRYISRAVKMFVERKDQLKWYKTLTVKNYDESMIEIHGIKLCFVFSISREILFFSFFSWGAAGEERACF